MKSGEKPAPAFSTRVAEPKKEQNEMNTKMYVGNLPFSANEAEVRQLFSAYGEVKDVHLPMDRDSGRPRGFAFVTMDTPEAMTSAINALHNKEWNGRTLTINEARPKEERSFSGPPRGDRSAKRNRW